jgi:hypothetical protein
MQLYRCDWLSDMQRSNVLLSLNSMSEKSSFMGVSDLPMIRSIELLPNASDDPKKMSSLGHRKMPLAPSFPSDLAAFVDENSSIFLSRPSIAIIDSKHDTRIVNEAFQVN